MDTQTASLMTDKERVLKKVDALIAQAQQIKPGTPEPKSKPRYDSLAANIKTQEQADFLRFMLKFT